MVVEGLICLIWPGTIRQDPSEAASATVFVAVFDSSEGMQHFTPLFNRCSCRKSNFFRAIITEAHYLWASDIWWKGYDCPHPITDSLVKETVSTLQLQNLLLSKTKLGNVHIALRPRNFACKLSWSFGWHLLDLLVDDDCSRLVNDDRLLVDYDRFLLGDRPRFLCGHFIIIKL